MHEERSNCSWIGVMVYIIFIFARMGACGGHEDRGPLCARAPLFRITRPLTGSPLLEPDVCPNDSPTNSRGRDQAAGSTGRCNTGVQFTGRNVSPPSGCKGKVEGEESLRQCARPVCGDVSPAKMRYAAKRCH
jgi:hypothetical protein